MQGEGHGLLRVLEEFAASFLQALGGSHVPREGEVPGHSTEANSLVRLQPHCSALQIPDK